MYKLVFFAPPPLPFLWNIRNCRCLGNYFWMEWNFSSKGYEPYIVPYPGENSLFVWVNSPSHPCQPKKGVLNLQFFRVPTRQCIFIIFCINCVCVCFFLIQSPVLPCLDTWQTSNIFFRLTVMLRPVILNRSWKFTMSKTPHIVVEISL